MKSILTFIILSFSLLLLQGCEDPDISSYRKAVKEHSNCISVNKGDCRNEKVKENVFSKFSQFQNELFRASYNIFSDTSSERRKIIDKINISYFKSLLSSSNEYDKLALVFYTIFDEQNLSAIIKKTKMEINDNSEEDMSKIVMAAIPKLINNADSISLEKRNLLGSLFYKNIMFEEALYILTSNNYPPLDKNTKNTLMNIVINTCSTEDAVQWYDYLTTVTTSIEEKKDFKVNFYQLVNGDPDIKTEYLISAKKETSKAIIERRLPHFYSEKCVALMTKKQLSYPYQNK